MASILPKPPVKDVGVGPAEVKVPFVGNGNVPVPFRVVPLDATVMVEVLLDAVAEPVKCTVLVTVTRVVVVVVPEAEHAAVKTSVTAYMDTQWYIRKWGR